MGRRKSDRSPSKASSHVRFSKEEYDKIEDDSVKTGLSIPTLLKDRYFSSPRPQPLLSKEDLANLLGQLGRLGNNVNQIARRINSGVREGFVGELDGVKETFDEICLFLTSKYCRCNFLTRA